MMLYVLSVLGLIPTFQKSKCKKLLNLTIKRVKLLKNRQEAQLRQLRRDVAELLKLGKEQKALVWICRIFKELRLMLIYSKISDYCQFVQANLADIAIQKDCPSGLEQPLASLSFAALCCANLPELQELREIFSMKYGRHFVTFPQELRPNCCVDQDFLDFFSAKDPSDTLKRAFLKEIASQYDVKQSNQEDSEDAMDEKVDAAPESKDVMEEGFSLRELAQELANRKRMYEGWATEGSSSKRAYRRQPSVDVPTETEESCDDGVHEVCNQHELNQIQVYFEQPMHAGPPQRAPPPPPPPPLPKRAPPMPLVPSTSLPPKRAPPLPPPVFRIASMPSSCVKEAIANIAASHYPCWSLDHNNTKATYRTNKLPPTYEDLVANFVALKQ